MLLCAVTEIDAHELHLSSAEFGILMFLTLREQEGQPATYDELLERIPLSKRTIDGALAKLRKKSLIQRVITYIPSDKGRAI